jgi:hypothetical protein
MDDTRGHGVQCELREVNGIFLSDQAIRENLAQRLDLERPRRALARRRGFRGLELSLLRAGDPVRQFLGRASVLVGSNPTPSAQ